MRLKCWTWSSRALSLDNVPSYTTLLMYASDFLIVRDQYYVHRTFHIDELDLSGRCWLPNMEGGYELIWSAFGKAQNHRTKCNMVCFTVFGIWNVDRYMLGRRQVSFMFLSFEWLNMNWMGGGLNRFAKQTNKWHTSSKRKRNNHTHRASDSRAVPGTSVSQFQPSFMKAGDPRLASSHTRATESRRSDPPNQPVRERSSPTQSKLENYKAFAPVIHRLESLRPPATKRTKVEPELQPATREEPIEISSDDSDSDNDNDNDDNHTPRSSDKQPLETIESKRLRLLEQSDWAGLQHTRPAKVHTDRKKRHPFFDGSRSAYTATTRGRPMSTAFGRASILPIGAKDDGRYMTGALSADDGDDESIKVRIGADALRFDSRRLENRLNSSEFQEPELPTKSPFKSYLEHESHRARSMSQSKRTLSCTASNVSVSKTCLGEVEQRKGEADELLFDDIVQDSISQETESQLPDEVLSFGSESRWDCEGAQSQCESELRRLPDPRQHEYRLEDHDNETFPDEHTPCPLRSQNQRALMRHSLSTLERPSHVQQQQSCERVQPASKQSALLNVPQTRLITSHAAIRLAPAPLRPSGSSDAARLSVVLPNVSTNHDALLQQANETLTRSKLSSTQLDGESFWRDFILGPSSSSPSRPHSVDHFLWLGTIHLLTCLDPGTKTLSMNIHL